MVGQGLGQLHRRPHLKLECQVDGEKDKELSRGRKGHCGNKPGVRGAGAPAAKTDITLPLVLPAFWQGGECFILQNVNSPKSKCSNIALNSRRPNKRFVLI